MLYVSSQRRPFKKALIPSPLGHQVREGCGRKGCGRVMYIAVLSLHFDTHRSSIIHTVNLSPRLYSAIHQCVCRLWDVTVLLYTVCGSMGCYDDDVILNT